jgi:epoxyqueuosine reductase
MDWWEKGNTKGNRRLMKTADEIRDRLAAGPGLWAEPLPYYPEKGGLFLKEAAALSGLGVIGRNNLFITPQYGARVRLRVLLLEEEVPAPGPPQGFDPCVDCPAPCRDACPQGALSKKGYSREYCLRQMNLDRKAAGFGRPGVTPEPVKYCRRCEHACLANRT